MGFLNFQELSLVLVCFIFVSASLVVWFSGTRLSRYTDAIAKKTGTADVVMGSLLLGGVTSLPEVVTTITASSIGNADIAVNNLFGGVALQVTILVIGDMMISRRSITSLTGSSAVQLQAIIGILLLAISACVIIVGDYALAHIGLGSILILIIFIAGFYLVSYFESMRWWKSDPDSRDSIEVAQANIRDKIAIEEEEREEKKDEEAKRQSFRGIMKTRLFLYLIVSAVAVLIGGYAVVQAGQAIAEKTGLGSSLVGAILIALSTSLPELSTTISSVRMQEYRLAFSNIFGTNIFTIGFIFLADMFYAEGPILIQVGDFSLFGAMLGIALTTIYLVGLSLRFKKTFLNMGYDSILVLVAYLSGTLIMITVF